MSEIANKKLVQKAYRVHNAASQTENIDWTLVGLPVRVQLEDYIKCGCITLDILIRQR